MWATWWIWGAASLVLAILEVVIPGFVLLGFAGGAALVAVLLVIGGGFGGWLAGSLAMLLVVFAVGSLVTWLVLRRVVGVHHSQVKRWTKDINDD
jgi:membrane protein implicated in regulation of membrane protease activity